MTRKRLGKSTKTSGGSCKQKQVKYEGRKGKIGVRMEVRPKSLVNVRHCANKREAAASGDSPYAKGGGRAGRA